VLLFLKKTPVNQLPLNGNFRIGSKVLPRRWVVERTLAWLTRYHRLVRVYEKRVASSVAMIWVSSIRILLKKLCPLILEAGSV